MMLDHLDRHNIAHAGAGRNIDEARRPALEQIAFQFTGKFNHGEHGAA